MECWGYVRRHGKLVSGADVVIESIQKHKSHLIIIAEDISEKTQKNIEYISEKNSVKVLKFGTIETLSKAIGKNNRAIISINDNNFAKELIKIICGGITIE
jgi:ribosomal protein L7Ae-like RNA K-turn-binding protein